MRIDKKLFENRNGVNFLSNNSKKMFVEIAEQTLIELRATQPELFAVGISEEALKYQYSRLFEDLFYARMGLGQDFIEYCVDVGYNRAAFGMKYVEEIDGIPGRTLFDLVVHQRGLGDRAYPENLIHFEFKGRRSRKEDIENDIRRLKLTTMGSNDPVIVPQGFYEENGFRLVRGYQLGIFASFYSESTRVKALNNGETFICFHQREN